jgi:hypothetical protein
MYGRAASGARTRSGSPFAASDVLIARDADGSVVLHVPSGTYLRLDGSATEILDLVRSEGKDGAVNTLEARYALDRERASADVADVLEAISSARATGDGKGRRPDLRGVATVVGEWACLGGPARLVTAEIGALVMALEVALRLVPIDAISRRLGVPLTDLDGSVGPGGPALDLEQLSDREVLRFAAVDWVLARWVFDATCLRRALAYGWVLRRRHPQLHIGLMQGGDVTAHAWLAVDGSTVGALGQVQTFHRMAGPGLED